MHRKLFSNQITSTVTEIQCLCRNSYFSCPEKEFIHFWVVMMHANEIRHTFFYLTAFELFSFVLQGNFVPVVLSKVHKLSLIPNKELDCFWSSGPVYLRKGWKVVKTHVFRAFDVKHLFFIPFLFIFFHDFLIKIFLSVVKTGLLWHLFFFLKVITNQIVLMPEVLFFYEGVNVGKSSIELMLCHYADSKVYLFIYYL